MARTYSCDGCGAHVEKPDVVGYVLKREYCEACAKNARAFLDALEEQLTRFRERFLENRKNLIDVHSKGGSIKLPDVP